MNCCDCRVPLQRHCQSWVVAWFRRALPARKRSSSVTSFVASLLDRFGQIVRAVCPHGVGQGASRFIKPGLLAEVGAEFELDGVESSFAVAAVGADDVAAVEFDLGVTGIPGRFCEIGVA